MNTRSFQKFRQNTELDINLRQKHGIRHKSETKNTELVKIAKIPKTPTLSRKEMTVLSKPENTVLSKKW